MDIARINVAFDFKSYIEDFLESVTITNGIMIIEEH